MLLALAVAQFLVGRFSRVTASLNAGSATRAALLVGTALTSVVLASGCRQPTEVFVEISTDADCRDVRDTSITSGHLIDIESAIPATVTQRCAEDSGRIGSIVIVPSGGDSDEFALRIVTGFTKSAQECVEDGYIGGCIVARRALRFLPHKRLDLPVLMEASCTDVPCSASQTCRSGQCVDATLPDPSHCTDPAGCPAAGAGGNSGHGGGSSGGASTAAGGTLGPSGGSTATSGSGGAPTSAQGGVFAQGGTLAAGGDTTSGQGGDDVGGAADGGTTSLQGGAASGGAANGGAASGGAANGGAASGGAANGGAASGGAANGGTANGGTANGGAANGGAANGGSAGTGATGGVGGGGPGFCGNGRLDPGEGCDDQNATSSDGCALCVVQAGFSCTGQPSQCSPTATLSFDDTSADDIPAQALRNWFDASSYDSSYYLFIAIDTSAIQGMEYCLSRGDWYADTYLTYAGSPAGGSATSGVWPKWWRNKGLIWSPPDVLPRINSVGAACNSQDPQSFCVEPLLGLQELSIMPGRSGRDESYLGGFPPIGATWRVRLTLSPTRQQACGF